MSNIVDTKADKSLQVSDQEMMDVLADFHVDSSDILIPKILLMQPTSEMVADGKAMIGDYRNSVTGEKIGTIVEPFEFVPFHYVKKWDIQLHQGNEWIRSEEFKAGDDNLPWEFEDAGVKYKRIKRVDLFGFIPEQVAKGTILPVTLSFKSTSYKEVTKVLTQMKLNTTKKQLPWSTYFTVKGEKLKNEDGQTYCVIKVDISGDTPMDMQKLCLDWYKNIKNLTVKMTVDEGDAKAMAAKDVQGDQDYTGKF